MGWRRGREQGGGQQHKQEREIWFYEIMNSVPWGKNKQWGPLKNKGEVVFFLFAVMSKFWVIRLNEGMEFVLLNIVQYLP